MKPEREGIGLKEANKERTVVGEGMRGGATVGWIVLEEAKNGEVKDPRKGPNMGRIVRY
jgi:hypothetical protein